MLENESILEKEVITEIEKEVEKEIKKRAEKEKKKFKLDKYFVTLDNEKEFISVNVYKGTEKIGKLLDSFKATPDKVIENILYGLSEQHLKYLKKEIKEMRK